MSAETPAARLRIALDMFEVGAQLMRGRLRREHPEWTTAQLDEAFRAWLHDRPGAPYGDHPGPPSDRVLGRPAS